MCVCVCVCVCVLLALGQTTTNRTAFRVVRDLSRLGSNSRTSVTRESVIFLADGLRSSVPAFVDIVSDMVRNPEFNTADIEAVKAYFSGELELRKHNSQSLMDEAIHAASFSGHTLGRAMSATAKSVLYFVTFRIRYIS